MASIQTEIHKYFKAKKNPSLHKGKDYSKPKEVICAKKLSSTTSKATIKGNKNSLLSYLEKVPNDASLQCNPSSPDKRNPEHQTSFSTPKRKLDSEDAPERKRKRFQEEDKFDINEKTPQKIGLQDSIIQTEQLSKSAKKRILCDHSDKELDGFQKNAGKVHYASPSKLNAQQVKEQLGKCNRLDELRARLLKLNQCQEKLKQFKAAPLIRSPAKDTPASPKLSKIRRKALFTSPDETEKKLSRSIPPSPFKLTSVHPQLEHFRSLDVDVPLSPVKSPLKAQSPLKSPCSPRKSCHQRFSHLVVDQKIPEEPELSLPFNYQFIKEIFRAVDTVVSLLHNRNELITFAKLKPSVQEMIRKAFYEKHLGQIKTVFPLAYFFKQEKSKNFNHERAENCYQLTVTANMNYKKQTQIATNLMDKFDKSSHPSLHAPSYRKMDSVVLLERRHIFHDALLSILKKHHNEFLKTLDPPIILDSPPKRWHPEFPIDEIEEPTPSPLPIAPNEKVVTAKELFDKAQDIFSVNNRMKTLLDTNDAIKSKKNDVISASTAPSIGQTPVSLALKGVSMSLLEKIRAKEAAKAAKEMTRPSSVNQKLEMLSRLPEIARITRNIFISEKKAAIAWEVLINKISSSYSSILATSEVDMHLNMLIKEVPDWCTIHKVRSGTYIKINKTRQLQEITDTLHKVIKENS